MFRVNMNEGMQPRPTYCACLAETFFCTKLLVQDDLQER